MRTARAAARALGGRWKGERIQPTTPAALLAGPERTRVLLCPEGRANEEDSAFLGEARRRILWPAPDADLAAAVAGLRGEHPAPLLPPTSETGGGRGRKSALLMEGRVTSPRAAKAARSQARDWIAESPFHVRLSRRRLRDLAALGVRWFALRPLNVEAVLVSSSNASVIQGWRRILPPRTKIQILPARSQRSPKRRASRLSADA
jgi:hypothetical protein